jgi:hypothetical protein
MVLVVKAVGVVPVEHVGALGRLFVPLLPFVPHRVVPQSNAVRAQYLARAEQLHLPFAFVDHHLVGRFRPDLSGGGAVGSNQQQQNTCDLVACSILEYTAKSLKHGKRKPFVKDSQRQYIPYARMQNILPLVVL